MKKLSLFLVLGMLVSLTSCQLAADIFKTGVGVGVFLVIGVIVLIIFVIGKVFGGGR